MDEDIKGMRKQIKTFNRISTELKTDLEQLKKDLTNILGFLQEQPSGSSKRRRHNSPVSHEPPPQEVVAAVPATDRNKIVLVAPDVMELHLLLNQLRSSTLGLDVDFSNLIAEGRKVKLDLGCLPMAERSARVGRLPFKFYYVNMKGHKDSKYEEALVDSVTGDGKLISWKINQTRFVPPRESRHFAFGKGSQIPLTINGSSQALDEWFGVSRGDPDKTLNTMVMSRTGVRRSTSLSFTVTGKPGVWYVDQYTQVLRRLTNHVQPPNGLGEVPDWWAVVGDVQVQYPSGVQNVTIVEVVWYNNTEDSHSYDALPDSVISLADIGLE